MQQQTRVNAVLSDPERRTSGEATPPSPAPRAVWTDAGVVAGSAVTGLFAAVGRPPATAAGVAAVLVLFLLSWSLLGRRALAGGRFWLAATALLVVACLAGAAVTPAFAVFQVVAFPVAWLLTPGLRTAIAANVAVAVAVGIGYAVGSSLLEALAVEGISLAFSLVMGLWITRVEERSASRQALVEQLTAAQRRIAALSREAGADAERERLGRELHDTLTQSVTGVVMLAERARSRHPHDEGLAVLEEVAREALAEARSLVAVTAAVPLEGGLAEALTALADRVGRESGLVLAVESVAEVPRDLEVVLLRCAQEGLANVRKHASARSAVLRLVRDGEDAVLTLEDDGVGPGDGRGFGLSGMRERLAAVAGDAVLTAAPEGGARLVVRVPVVAVEAGA